MENLALICFTMMLAGQILLAISLIQTKATLRKTAKPAMLFLLSNLVIALEPVMTAMPHQAYSLYIPFTFPAIFLLNISLLLYIGALTQTTTNEVFSLPRFQYGFLLLSAAVFLLLIFLPEEQRILLFITENDEGAEVSATVAIVLFLSVIAWCIQSIMTLWHIVRRLRTYRQCLRDYLANTEQFEMNWLTTVLTMTVICWSLALFGTFASELTEFSLLSPAVRACFYFALIWLFILFCLKQETTFLEFYSNLDNKPDNQNELLENDELVNSNDKYQRSALDQNRSERLANKLNSAMQTEKLYLDSSLTLHKVANHLSVSPNYISQVLNETMNTKFFDFVNQWRIEEAKPKLLNDNQSVLSIALDVGFNARSSFYKSFKQYTGVTPSEFRAKAK